MRKALVGLVLAATALTSHASGYFTEDAVPFDSLIGSNARHQDFSGPFVRDGYS
jgi:hypothetical protein